MTYFIKEEKIDVDIVFNGIMLVVISLGVDTSLYL